jgi:hypothetical protein
MIMPRSQREIATDFIVALSQKGGKEFLFSFHQLGWGKHCF